MNSSAHMFPPLEANEDHYFPFLSSPSQTSHSSSSSIIRPTAIYPTQDQQGRYHLELLKPYQQSQEVDDFGGSSSDHQTLSPPSLSTLESGSDYGLKISIFEGDQLQDQSPTSESGPVSWMSSKMRLMKKMINSDRSSMDGDQKPRRGKLWFQDQNSPCNANNTTSDNLGSNSTMIRTCSDCNTTRTPLWRSGPKGPKSLCNACGIRQRKARRAMAAAATANGGLAAEKISSMQTTKVHCTKKKSGKGHTSQQRKHPKLGTTSNKRKNLGFEDFIVNLSNNLSLHRVIQQDETEAAILLMALSYGLVSS
ncbi:hypothetical protein ACHQM5_001831 [Ranunculus cassubicifolius]